MLGTERILECRRLCYNFLLGSSLGHSKSRVFQRTSILRAPIHDFFFFFFFVEVIPKLFDHLLNLVRRFKLPPNVQKPASPGNRTSLWGEWDPPPAEGNRALPCGAQLILCAFFQTLPYLQLLQSHPSFNPGKMRGKWIRVRNDWAREPGRGCSGYQWGHSSVLSSRESFCYSWVSLGPSIYLKSLLIFLLAFPGFAISPGNPSTWSWEHFPLFRDSGS